MPDQNPELIAARRSVNQAQQNVERLRREAFARWDASPAPDSVYEELSTAEQELAQAESALAALVSDDPDSGLLVHVGTSSGQPLFLGAATTGLSVEVFLRMAQVPTAFYHLLDAGQTPLVSCQVTNHSDTTRRMRVTSFIEGYSARAVTTFEIEPKGRNSSGMHTFDHLPTLFPEPVSKLNELARASLNVLVEDLDSEKVESHTTHPIWMLPRTTAPLAVRDPKTGEWSDLTEYLGAYVTPNALALMNFLRIVADLHPDKRLVGYQGDANEVDRQVRAVYEALKREAHITYINSIISFGPDRDTSIQRLRLPSESLSNQSANCLDGAVLFASLLEAISLNPALVLIPGHAFLGWESQEANDEWQYLETTMVGNQPYEMARREGNSLASRYRALSQAGQGVYFKVLSLRQLRAERGVVPME